MDELHVAKYFRLHSDQLSVTVQHVQVNATPCEHFLGFLKNTGHKSEQLAKAVVELLRSQDSNLDDCREQSDCQHVSSGH